MSTPRRCLPVAIAREVPVGIGWSRPKCGKLGSDEHLGESLHLTPITFRVFPR